MASTRNKTSDQDTLIKGNSGGVKVALNKHNNGKIKKNRTRTSKRKKEHKEYKRQINRSNKTIKVQISNHHNSCNLEGDINNKTQDLIKIKPGVRELCNHLFIKIQCLGIFVYSIFQIQSLWRSLSQCVKSAFKHNLHRG